MRWIAAAMAFMLALASTASADEATFGLPDLSRTYYKRINCHIAYDQLAQDLAEGRAISNDDRDWAVRYEENAEAEVACPAPPEELGLRAANRVVSNKNTIANLIHYVQAEDPAAYFEAGWGVVQGEIAGIEPIEGYRWMAQAAQLGYPPAQFNLGALMIAGNLGTPNDYENALPLVEAAADAGHVDAQFMMANAYAGGTGVRENKEAAFELYANAAEQGHVYAAFAAAMMANDGDGVETDHELAYRIARNLVDLDQPVGAVVAVSALLQMDDVKSRQNEILYWMDLADRRGDADVRERVAQFRPRVMDLFDRMNAPPPAYRPREHKACPMQTVCYVDQFTGARQCTTNKDYWSDCDY